MSHGPASDWGRDSSAKYKSRIGLKMFYSYTFIYALFVFISSTTPKAMGIPLWGLNLAIVYGFGLIGLAFVLAIIYNHLCSKKEETLLHKSKMIEKWYDHLSHEKLVPPGFQREKVLAFCEALMAHEIEVNLELTGPNMTGLQAFQSLFEKTKTEGEKS